MLQNAVFDTGTIVLFSSGEYSDRGLCGEVKLLRSCDFRALAQEYKDQYTPEDDWDDPEPIDFVAWLVRNQHVEQIDCSSLHLGSYGELNIR